jgi:hypothetical protein
MFSLLLSNRGRGFLDRSARLQLTFEGGDHFVGGITGTVKGAFRCCIKFGVDPVALFGRVFVGVRELGDDGDDASGGLEFQLLAALEAGLAADCRGNYKRGFVVVFYGDGGGVLSV